MRTLLLSLACLAALPALAQPTAAPPAADQVVRPDVARRDVKLPKYPSKDFSVGLFAGTFATQNFGSSAVAGLRLGYEVTEDIFVEAAFAQTTVTDQDIRDFLPGVGIFETPEQKLSYYNLSAGWNVLPGEVFIGRNIAKASQFYLIGGVGSTDFVGQKRQTFNFGFGYRVLFTDRFAVRVDMRDHIFSLDLLGRPQSTQNLELTAGLNYFF